MPWICAGAFAGVLGPQRGVAALADQIADLAVKIANGIADQMRCLAGRFGEALHFVGDDRKAAACFAGAGRLDGCVQRQQIGLLGDRLDRTGYLGHLRKRGADRAEAMLDAADSFDQFGDMLHGCLHRSARLHDLADGGRRGGLHRLRRSGDVVIGRDHGLGGFLKMPETVGLGGDPAGNFLQIARDVGKFNPKAADPGRQQIDQAFAIRGVGRFRFRRPHNRHCCISPVAAREED